MNWTAVILIVSLGLLTLLLVGGSGRHYTELLPPGRTDPEYVVNFKMDAVEFSVPNKYLWYPWHSGEQPEKCPADGGPARNAALDNCTSSHHNQSLSMQFSYPDFQQCKHNTPCLGADLNANRDFPIIDEDSVEQLQETYFKGQRLTRIPKLDIGDYIAYEHGGGPYVENTVYLNRAGKKPWYVHCQNYGDKAGKWSGPICSADTPFLERTFPPNARGIYPFIIRYSFPVSLINEANLVGAIKAHVAALISEPMGLRQ